MPPMSRCDSLVVVVGVVVVGNGKENHQRVIVTRWLVLSLSEMARKPPTSRHDSLVVVIGVVAVENGKKCHQ